MQETDTAVHTRKRLLLFMSVDLAGSTAFKSKSVHGAVQPWLPVFVEFFREFPAQLRHFYTQLQDQPADLKPPAPRLWKAIGDELVFAAEISHHGEIPVHLRFFRETVRAYRERLRREEKKLDLKATAWVAGVPVFNSVILLPGNQSDGSLIEDYIGPSIDAGFRLAKLATPRRLILSVELAWVLARMQGTFVKDFDFHYDGGEELKGVLGGYPYPVIWTDLHLESPLERAEAKLLPKLEPASRDQLGEFTETLIKTLGPPLFIPFIENDPAFGNHGGDLYDADYKGICRTWNDLYANQLGETRQPTTEPEVPFANFKQQTESGLTSLLVSSTSPTPADEKDGPTPPKKSRARKPRP